MRSTMIRASHPFHADPRFLLEPFEPAYLALHRAGALAERVAAGLGELEDCCACPRNCQVNRMENETRVCHTGRYARVASSFAHFGEEDCLRGWNGSGTIFFSLCNLRLRSSARTGTSASRPSALSAHRRRSPSLCSIFSVKAVTTSIS